MSPMRREAFFFELVPMARMLKNIVAKGKTL
jgi:hypothetical protein